MKGWTAAPPGRGLGWTEVGLGWLKLLLFLHLTIGCDSFNSSLTSTIFVNKGENVSLTCVYPPSGAITATAAMEVPPPAGVEVSPSAGVEVSPPAVTGDTVEWILPGRANTSATLIKQLSGDLYIVQADEGTEGEYNCINRSKQYTVRVKLRRLPETVQNLTISTHSVYATVSWAVTPPSELDVEVDGFICLYSNHPVHSTYDSEMIFINSSQHLGPGSRTCDLYDLTPGQTYLVKVAAYNSAGVGGYVSALLSTTPGPAHSHTDTRLLWMMVSAALLSLLLLLVGVGMWCTRRRGCVCYDRQPVSPLQDYSPDEEEEESLELVPHITLNPNFNIEMLEHISPDYNENSEHAFLVNGR